jgi:hypothetical protein
MIAGDLWPRLAYGSSLASIWVTLSFLSILKNNRNTERQGYIFSESVRIPYTLRISNEPGGI